MDSLTLVAVAPDGERQRFALTGDRYVVGREDGGEPDRLAVIGDRHLSRQQFELHPRPSGALVIRHQASRNPIYYEGRERDRFEVGLGEWFFVGKSRFQLSRRGGTLTEFTLSRHDRDISRLSQLQTCFEAVLDLLKRLREPGLESPWLPAFTVLKRMLPEAEELAAVHRRQPGQYEILETQGSPAPKDDLLERAVTEASTVFWIEDHTWAIASPIEGIEAKSYLLYANGSGKVAKEQAAILDLVAELVAHHLVVQQAAEYSHLLHVFGHQIGTLFKTSGALKLWSETEAEDPVHRVLDRLLPVWGVSQAISLHKKRSEKEHGQWLREWVDPEAADQTQIVAALKRLVRYLHAGQNPFLPWYFEDEPLDGKPTRLVSLPPLRDNPLLFDKTLAFTLGLLEVLNNILKYPGTRGSDREDRRDLSELSDGDRRVRITARAGDTVELIIHQPLVTNSGGEIPRSGSLERIRKLERQVLFGWVETHAPELVRVLGPQHVVLVEHRWSYRWQQLLTDWNVANQG